MQGRSDANLAFTLHAVDGGWSWTVLDADGLPLASGMTRQKAAALELIRCGLRRAGQPTSGTSATDRSPAPG